MAVSDFVEGMAIGMLRFGKMARDLGKELGVSYAMQYRWWNRWLHEGGTCEKEKGFGRLRKTMKRADARLLLACK